MSDLERCSRMPYWGEMTSEQRIEHMADVIRMMARELRRLHSAADMLTYHSHDQNGRAVLSIGIAEPEIPYWLTNPLREENR